MSNALHCNVFLYQRLASRSIGDTLVGVLITDGLDVEWWYTSSISLEVVHVYPHGKKTYEELFGGSGGNKGVRIKRSKINEELFGGSGGNKGLE